MERKRNPAKPVAQRKDTVVNSLASETGLSNNQVNSTLSTIAPALLSGLSAATTSAQNQSSGVNLSDGLDFGDLMALFGGSNNNAASSLLGTLMGGGQQQTQQSNGMGDILGALLGTQQTQQQSTSSNNAMNGLLSALLGGGTTQTTTSKKKKTNSQIDGTDLLNLLTALSK